MKGIKRMWKKGGIFYERINGKIISLGTKDKKEAIQILANLDVHAADKSLDSRAGNRILLTYIQEYLQYHTDDKSKYALELLKPYHHAKLANLDIKSISFYMASLKKRSMPSYNIVLRAFFNWMKRQNYVSDSFGNVEKLPQNHRIVVLKNTEIAKLLENASPEWQRIIKIYLQSGVRRTELYDARYEDMDFDKDEWRIKGKRTQKGQANDRVIPIPQILYEDTERYGYVIHHYYDPDALTQAFGKIRNKANLKKASIHALRHTFATNLLNSGVDIAKVQEWLGHASIEMTRKYIHFTAKNLSQEKHKINWV